MTECVGGLLVPLDKVDDHVESEQNALSRTMHAT